MAFSDRLKKATYSPSYKWYVVAFLFLSVSLNYADRTSISSVFPLLRRDLGASDLAMGAIGSVFLWSYGLASPFGGYIGDRVSRPALISLSLAGWSLATLAAGLVSTVLQILVTRVALGLAECLYLPAAIAFIADYHPARTRGTAIAIHTSGLYAGMVTGGAFAGYMAERLGWRSPFITLGVAGLALAALSRASIFASEPPPQTNTERTGISIWEAVASLLRIRSFLILLAEAMLMAIGTWIFITWLPLYFKETFAMSLAKAGFLGPLVIQGAAVLGILGGGYPSDWLARRNVKYRMLLQAACYFASVPFLLVFLWSARFNVIAVCIFGFSLVRSFGMINEQPLVCDLLRPNLRATAVGLMNMMNSLAGGAGVLVAAYLKSSFGLAGVFAGISAIVLAAGALLVLGYAVFVSRDLLQKVER
jgi:MFS transporter, Spinster family, sphingosine-1-phosphate transporter